MSLTILNIFTLSIIGVDLYIYVPDLVNSGAKMESCQFSKKNPHKTITLKFSCIKSVLLYILSQTSTLSSSRYLLGTHWSNYWYLIFFSFYSFPEWRVTEKKITGHPWNFKASQNENHTFFIEKKCELPGHYYGISISSVFTILCEN